MTGAVKSTLHDSESALVAVRDLKKHFPMRRRFASEGADHIKAVDGVSFDIPAGRTLGLVGESGSGKTTVGRSILRLIEPTAGEILFDDVNVLALRGRALRGVRRQMQMVFQDPVASLNPRMTAAEIVGEGLQVHRVARGRDLRERVAGLMRRVGLSADDMDGYPHVFSGGQRQRIGIARAIALDPRFIVCDEPVSALDVSVRLQILNLLDDLRRERGLACLLITHDLTVVRRFCDDVAVMYFGRIVETGSAENIFANPRHPYTKALLSAVPVPDPDSRTRRFVLPGEVPDPLNPPSGCPFHPRCPFAVDRCRTDIPDLISWSGAAPRHRTACHYADQDLPLPVTVSAP
ncbi:MAG: ATP-binding cassette domain-containing protein [Phycisphaerales bacterium]|nr:ATP-binding cassette domain-containing protein [Phycisphaerales bacterium]